MWYPRDGTHSRLRVVINIVITELFCHQPYLVLHALLLQCPPSVCRACARTRCDFYVSRRPRSAWGGGYRGGTYSRISMTSRSSSCVSEYFSSSASCNSVLHTTSKAKLLFKKIGRSTEGLLTPRDRVCHRVIMPICANTHVSSGEESTLYYDRYCCFV